MLQGQASKIQEIQEIIKDTAERIELERKRMMEAHECQLEIKINELENYKSKLD